jgi:predicted ATP-grasp superfamily ATP-dependent carboligase
VRIFVYEYLTAGGRYLDGSDLPGGSLLREGRAMLEAVCSDLSRLPNVQIVGLRDARLVMDDALPMVRQAVGDAADHGRRFDELARTAEWTLLIAPEIDGRLSELVERAEQLGARLISPDSAFVRLASDKVKTADLLSKAGVSVPATFLCLAPSDAEQLATGPWVVKPIDGAGSWQVRLVDRDGVREHLRGGPRCVQAYCPGRPASVAALCGCGEPEFLPPCWQWVAPPSFEYRGGEVMAQPAMIRRAHRLARSALAALPPTRGYVGLDLVLGPNPEGREDAVIEVNPRLTTSYVGLRRQASANLGEAMWCRATARPARLSFRSTPLQFDADGTLRRIIPRPDVLYETVGPLR